MASLWKAPAEIARQVEQLKAEHHPHLQLASVWVLCTDQTPINNDNQVVVTKTQKTTKAEKLATGHDFKITIRMDAWAVLTDKSQVMALDEALCACGVRYVPAMMEINGREEVYKDGLGRVIYTDEIAYDKEGNPRWKVNAPDAPLWFRMLHFYGEAYNEHAANVQRVCAGQPPKLPSTTPLFDGLADTDEAAANGADDEDEAADEYQDNYETVGA